MSKHGRILVAMSGGIDSSVTAAMLHEEGYEVIGLTMKTWDYQTSGGSKKETGCCSLDSINDARQMAVDFGFHHYILDIREEFGDFIIDNFVDEYLAGRTPNPCVLCNTHIKWTALLKRADMLGCEKIATGHYARVVQENGRWTVKKGRDELKDQSYVLWGLSQENLGRSILPLGGFRKSEIREMALGMGYEALAKKSESYEICFIPDNDYRGFLQRRDPGLKEQVQGGNFVNSQGQVLGQHKGYPFYTVGQRKGLGIALGEPHFVLEIRPKTNEVVLGLEHELQKKIMHVKGLNWVHIPQLEQQTEALTKIRYKDRGAESVLFPVSDDQVKVEFHHGVNAIAPGQSAVFYQDDTLLGGGFIMRDDEVKAA